LALVVPFLELSEWDENSQGPLGMLDFSGLNGSQRSLDFHKNVEVTYKSDTK
jgi:hypothetical protein